MLDQMAYGDTPHMLLVNLAGELREKQLLALQEGHEDWAKRIVPTASDARVALEENEFVFAVVVYSSPVDQIVSGLLDGMSPTAALVAAQDSMESMLELAEKFTGRILFSEFPTTESNLEIFVESVVSLTGTSWKPAKLPPEPGVETPRSAVHILSACQLLRMKYPNSLVNELVSRSIPMNRGFYTPELVQAVLDEKAQAERHADDQRRNHAFEVTKNKTLNSEMQSLKNESFMVMAQLHRTQEELEELVFRDSNQKKMIDGFRRGRDYRKKRISELESKLRNLRGAQTSTRGRIAQLEGELESSREKTEWLRTVRDQHRQVAKELRDENRKLSAKLDRMQSSRSWKYTSLLRKLNGNRA
jgi:hypothetical protein